MSMGESVKWSVPAMQAGHDDIDATAKRLGGIFESLNQQLAPMRQFWAGRGNESYDAVQQRWNQAMQNMLDLLARIVQSLEVAANIHEQTEQSIINAWEG